MSSLCSLCLCGEIPCNAVFHKGGLRDEEIVYISVGIEIEVGEEWQEYWTTFTASLSGPVWPRIALGTSDVNIWVDNVRLYEGDYEEEEDISRNSAVTPSGKLPITWAGVKELMVFD